MGWAPKASPPKVTAPPVKTEEAVALTGMKNIGGDGIGMTSMVPLIASLFVQATLGSELTIVKAPPPATGLLKRVKTFPTESAGPELFTVSVPLPPLFNVPFTTQ